MMSLPPSNCNAIDLLHESVVKWLYSKEWSSLRELQERAIPLILDGQHDVILSASTAGGKTEAAFLPVITSLCNEPPVTGAGCLCLSPLKALINDQYDRLIDMNRYTGIDVTAWHGDVQAGQKSKFRKNPNGILLITPESLEAMFVNRGTVISRYFEDLRYIVVDELHAFFGSERGRQLQSLMDRLECVLDRKIIRIALSATLADMSMASSFLRHDAADNVKVVSSNELNDCLKLQIRGYEEKEPDPDDPIEGGGLIEIADHLFKTLRGTNNLVFGNSRPNVEELSVYLKNFSDEMMVPNEFYPHHGSLDKEIRMDAEEAIKSSSKPASVVCTSTLELGIDIGAVESVAQIGPPPSVISLKQRLGRSGRRDGEPKLRQYVLEPAVAHNTSLIDELRFSMVRAMAMIELLMSKTYEPPAKDALHLSTLVQQLLSAIAQYGSISAKSAYNLLCKKGPFNNVDAEMFQLFLRAMGEKDLISQMHDGDLVLGLTGERVTNHYSFYTAFNTPEEYRILAGAKRLGSMPILMPLMVGLPLIFAGRKWVITAIDDEQKIVSVEASAGAKVPLFGGSGPLVHDIVRQEMLRIYAESDTPRYMDKKSAQMLANARQAFNRYELGSRKLIMGHIESHLIPWVGDTILATLQMLFLQKGVKLYHIGPALCGYKVPEQNLRLALQGIVDQGPIDAVELALSVKNKLIEKHDIYLSEELLCQEYAHRVFDTERAWLTANELLTSEESS